MIETDDRKRLDERVRQEIDLAAQRPVEPTAPQNGIVTAPVPGVAAGIAVTPRWIRLKHFLRAIPVLGPALGAVNRVRRHPRWRERLRGVPLLGGALAWANGLRHLAATRRQVAEIAARQAAAEADQAEIAARQAAAEADQAEIAARQAAAEANQAAAIGNTEERFQLVAKHLADRDEELVTYGRLLAALEERLNAGRREMDALRRELAAVTRHSHQQGAELLLLQRRLSRMQEVSSSAPARPATAVPAASDALDAYYAAFEESFRGSRDEIKQRLSIYPPYLEAAGLAATGKPVVDLGCGRGEWLDVLRDAGYPAYGIDLNSVNVEGGRACGQDVRQEDAIGHLRGLAEGSLAAVTAFHLIEHLAFEGLVELVEEANRVLVSGGVLIMETPNPENLQVGACTFRNDPTHRQPIPPAVARFLVENRGFVQAEIVRLHPYPETDRVVAKSDLARRFNQFLYGPQDYAVIGRKI
jgi:SAM-dependent methyltransferase